MEVVLINKRIHSDATKKKIGDSNPRKRDIIEKKCLNCESKFNTKSKNKQFCSRSCGSSYTNKNRKLSSKTKLKLSDSLKEQYKNGRLNYAGWTKWYELNTSNGKIKVQGTYEVKAVEILEELKLKNKIKNWEYTKDTIEYIGEDKKKHIYLLDFKVFEKNNTFYYIETKGYKTKKDELKWKAAKDNKVDLRIWYKNNLFCDR